jgi:hypothetical protein
MKKKYKQQYLKYKEQGLCSLCGKVEPIDGKTCCQECAKKRAEAQERAREKRRLKNLCPNCGRQSPENGK